MYGQRGADCRRGNQCRTVAKEGPNCLSNLPDCQNDGQATETPEVSMTAALQQFLQLNQA